MISKFTRTDDENDIMTLKERIINSYNIKCSKRELNDTQKTDLLFDVLLHFIIKNNWTYFPDGHAYSADFMLGCTDFDGLQVNCFELSRLFIALCKVAGFNDADTVVYKHKPSSKIGQQLNEANSEYKYKFQCFDKQFVSIDNQECFDQHCVAKVNNRFYDLVFSCSYEHIDAPYDTGPFATVYSFINSNNEMEALNVLQSSDDVDLEQTFRGESLLHIATRANCVAIVSFLLNKGVNANKPSKLNPPQIALACVSDVNSELFILLSKYTDPVIVESIKKDLHYSNAVSIIDDNGSIEEFSKATQGIDIDYQSESGWTLLHNAANANNVGITEFLLAKGANANIKDGASFLPLHYATNSELITLLSQYTDTDTETYTVENSESDTEMQRFSNAVIIIARNGSIEEFSKAIQGIDIDFKDEGGWTLLHRAASTNNVGITEFLLAKGANANIKDVASFPPLQYATNSELITLLSQYTDTFIVGNTESDTEIQRFNNALYIIDLKGSIDEFSKAIQDIDINFKDSRGWTLLHFAALANNLIIAEFLLQNGANPNIRDVASFPPLQYAGEVDSSMYQLLYDKTEQIIPERASEETELASKLSPWYSINELEFDQLHDNTQLETQRSICLQPSTIRPPAIMNISLQILGGFMAAVGCAAIATAFILLNTPIAGLVLTTCGAASILAGVGLFGAGTYKNRQSLPNESLGETPSLSF